MGIAIIRAVALTLVAAMAGPAAAATLTMQFSGNLGAVLADSTNSPNAPSPSTLLGGAYTGTLTWDTATGIVSQGTLRFAAGYGLNNFASTTTPEFAKSQWLWGDITYALAGTVTQGATATLVMGGVLDPLTMKANSPAVDALGTSNLAGVVAGSPPVCTSLDPARQAINCFEPPANVVGLDALVLALGNGVHTLAFDEIIDFCGPVRPCSTSWYHFTGGGTTAVPLPSTLLLLAPGLAWVARFRRRRR